jgi:hypothetical protein
MENNKLPIYYASIDDNAKGIELKEQGVQNIALVDSPAMLTEWLMFEEHKKQSLKFALNEEQRIITAPVIIADLPIYRKDEFGKEFYVVYKKPIIMQMAQKYGSENRNRLVNQLQTFEYQNGKHQPNDSKSSFALKMQLQGEYIGKMTEHNSRLTSERNEHIEANYINNKISNAIE